MSKHERIVYVAPSVKPGDSISWGDWRDTEGPHTWYDDKWVGNGNALGRYHAKGIRLTVIEYATGSDYSGTLVEASNARVLKERFPWLVTLYGGHGTFGVAYLGKRENQNPELIEALDGLEIYPLADEDDHSTLECERVDESWSESYGGRHDFKRALVKLWSLDDNEYDEDKLDDSAIDSFWYVCTERLRGGEDHINESGDSIYFPIDRVIEDFRRDDRRLYDSFTWGDDPRPLIERLEELRLSALVSDNTQPTTESEHV
jgi:hypothetical protein